MEELINKLATTLQEIESYHGVVQDLSAHTYIRQLHQQAREYLAEMRKMVDESKLVEAQAEYIRKQGFLAYVVPTTDELKFYTICIRKITAGQILGVDWAISPLDLQYSLVPEQILREQADERITMMKRAIAERTGEQE